MTGRLRPQSSMLRSNTGTGPLRPQTGQLGDRPRPQTGTLGRSDEVELPVIVLTNVFQVRGRMWIRGVMQTYLSNEQKHTLSINNADVLGMEASNPAARMTQPEVVVSKRSAGIILVEVRPPDWALMTMPRMESLVAYTERFALMGMYHMSPDVRLQDFAAVSASEFIVATDVKVFPLFQARPGVVQSAPVALIHKQAITLFHAL
jgi:hypothetical protein